MAHRQWVQEGLKTNAAGREAYWTEAVAVGNKEFVDTIKERLGYRAKGRKVMKGDGGFELRESVAPYNSPFMGKKGLLSPSNAYNLDV